MYAAIVNTNPATSATSNGELNQMLNVVTKYFSLFPLFLQKSKALLPPPVVAQLIDGRSADSLSPSSGGK